MVPEFPKFAHLRAEHIEEIKELVRSLPEYSDYNPASLIAWNVHQETKISNLHGNLVVVFSDYLDGSQFISLHGTRSIEAASRAVFQYAYEHKMQPMLKLVPEETARLFYEVKDYEIIEDRDNFDYLISLENIAHASGRRFQNIRRQIKAFTNTTGPSARYVTLDLKSPQHVREIMSVFAQRESQRPDNDEQSEKIAVSRLIRHCVYFKLHARGIRIHGRLEAFIIIEQSYQELVGHFWKANTEYSGIYHYLLSVCSQEFYRSGFKEMNIEQDLGIEGLRIAKKLLHPQYRKKYSIQMSKRAPLTVPAMPRFQRSTLSLQR